MGDRAGRKDERALVYWLLGHAWGLDGCAMPASFDCSEDRWRASGLGKLRQDFKPQKVGRGPERIDREIADRFKENLLRREERDRSQANPPSKNGSTRSPTSFDAHAWRPVHERQELVASSAASSPEAPSKRWNRT